MKKMAKKNNFQESVDDILRNLKSSEKFLEESPMHFERPYYENIQDVVSNHNNTIDIANTEEFIGSVKIQNTDFLIFQKTVSGRCVDFFINGKKGFEITQAFVEYNQSEGVMYSHGLWQMDNNFSGLIKSLIKDYYSTIFESIVCDNLANNMGKNFWEKLSKEYYNSGNRVTVLLRDENLNPVEIPYDPQNFDSYWKRIGINAPVNILIKIYF